MRRLMNKHFIAALVAGGVTLQLGLLALVYLYVIRVDDRLAFLESTIVGSCLADIDVPEGARCRQGFHRPQARQAINELCRINGLDCVIITDGWPE